MSTTGLKRVKGYRLCATFAGYSIVCWSPTLWSTFKLGSNEPNEWFTSALKATRYIQRVVR